MQSESLFQNDLSFELVQLNLLNSIYNVNSQHRLQTLLMPGMNVLELGCGSATLGRWIAGQIGEEGTYVGIEHNSQQIMLAEQQALGNMVFIESTIERIDDIALLKGTEFDLIYSRWALARILPRHIKRLLKTLYSMLTPHGKLICEESDFSVACCVEADNHSKRVDNVAFAQWYRLSFALAKCHTIHYTLGKNIAHWLGEAAGCVPYTSTFHPHLMDASSKQLLVKAMQSQSAEVINQQLATDKALKALVEGLQYLADDVSVHIHFAKNRVATVVRTGG